jgi:PAS domain S-box-containing protein
LRQQAEEMARKAAAPQWEAMSPEETRRTLHELRVHQVELEMQNKELRRTQEELKASQAQYSELYDQAPVGYLTLDEQGLILKANLAAARLLGVTSSALTKQPFTRFILPAEHDLYYVYRKQLHETGSRHSCELRMLKSDGTAFWTHLLATSAPNAVGVPVIYVTLRDIAERKRAEEALRRSEERYRELFDRASEGIFFITLDGTLVAVNDAFAQMHGYRAAEMLHMRLEDLDTPDTFQRLPERIARIRAGESITFEVEHYHRDGHAFPLEVSASLITSGGESYIQCFHRDITERKQAEAVARVRLERNRLHQQVLAAASVLPAATEGDLDAFAEHLVEQAARAVGAERASVWLLNADESELRCLNLYEASPRRHSAGVVLTRRQFTNEFEALLTTKYVDADDPLTDVRTAGYVEGYLKPLHITSMLDTVIRISGRNLGVLFLEHVDRPHHWEPDEIVFACQLSDLIAIAMINAERRQADTALRFAQFAMEQMADAIFWVAEDGRIDYANAAGCRSLGYTEAELLRLYIADIDVDFTRDRWPQHWQELKRAGSLFFESWLRPRMGSPFHVEIRANYMTFGGRDYNCAFVRDITERSRALESLAASERRLRDAQRLAHIGSWQWVVATDTVTWSEELYRIAGQDPSLPAPSYAALAACYTPGSWEQLSAAVAEVLKGGSPYELELAMVRPDGGTRCVLTRGESDHDDSGRIVGLQGTCQDISQRKLEEEAREKLESQLHQAQKLESVGRLAGGVAHDFNNLLMGIMNYVELCQDELAPEHPVRGYLDEITRDAQRSADITKQLLAFARKQVIAPKVLDLNDALVGMLKMLRHLMGEDIAVNWMPGTHLWPVKIDHGQLDQILANLCINARDAIAGVGRVTIETANVTLDQAYCAEHPGTAPGEYVGLAVSDTGCGMSQDVLAHIFEPFYTTKEVGKGTGLGLATVYGIVEQSHGHIEVQSEVSKGTTFRIHLPRAAKEPETAAVALPPERPPRGTETVLLAEDEKSVRVTSRLLLEALGYTVLAAATPEEVLSLAGAHTGPIHLLISDVIMPGMNGPDLASFLAGEHPKLRCLFMSGYTADVMTQRGTLSEGMPFLSKPFSRDDLARKVREVLDGETTKAIGGPGRASVAP